MKMKGLIQKLRCFFIKGEPAKNYILSISATHGGVDYENKYNVEIIG